MDGSTVVISREDTVFWRWGTTASGPGIWSVVSLPSRRSLGGRGAAMARSGEINNGGSNVDF